MHSHGVPRLGIHGMMLLGKCWYDFFHFFFFFLRLCSGAGWIRLFRNAGMGMDDLLVMTGE